jgi:uncharacterized Zn-binding protein involved in type VI secretion
MSTVAVNSPKSPVTKGSSGTAAATVPNICKMPGPPAPFVPTPLPNIGTSDNSPQGYSTSVTMDGQPVAIKGATFNSKGDIASQGTGGGLISSNVQGPTSFVGPGSMDVKIEGKNVQLLGDPMLNNCGPGGSPPNAATTGVIQAPVVVVPPVLEFDSAQFPEKTKNMKSKMDSDGTKTLHREKSASARRLNRRTSLKDQDPAGAGKSLDEFPFASCKEGGKDLSVDKDPAVAAIDKREQNKQGGKMSSFYQKHNIPDGGAFVVKIV